MQSLRQGLKIHQIDGMQVIENSNTTLKNIAHAAPAATVILVQEKNGMPEIFMAQREKRTHWGSQFVFPGGTVTNEDMAVHTLQHKNMSPKSRIKVFRPDRLFLWLRENAFYRVTHCHSR